MNGETLTGGQKAYIDFGRNCTPMESEDDGCSCNFVSIFRDYNFLYLTLSCWRGLCAFTSLLEAACMSWAAACEIGRWDPGG